MTDQPPTHPRPDLATLVALGQTVESLRLGVAGINAAMSRTPLGERMLTALGQASNATHALLCEHEALIDKLIGIAAESDAQEST